MRQFDNDEATNRMRARRAAFKMMESDQITNATLRKIEACRWRAATPLAAVRLNNLKNWLTDNLIIEAT